MKDLTLYTKIESLPKDLKKEAIDFIDFLTHKLSKEKPVRTPRFGSAKGKIKLSADFDEPLDDFKEYE